MHNPNQSYPPNNIQQQHSKSNKTLWIILSIVIGAAAILIGSCAVGVIFLGVITETQPTTNKSTEKKINALVEIVSVESDTELVNGELDYGYKVTAFVKNLGEADNFKVVPSLSCSEGEWSRTQNLSFGAGESKTLTYFFHEPTINVTNCQSKVRVSP